MVWGERKLKKLKKISNCTVEFYPPTEETEFFRTRRQRRLNYQLFSPKVICATSLSDRREEIFTFLCAKAPIGKTDKKQNKNKKKQIFILCVLCVLCVLELNVKIGKIGSKIGKIGNLAFARRRFLKNFL